MSSFNQVQSGGQQETFDIGGGTCLGRRWRSRGGDASCGDRGAVGHVTCFDADRTPGAAGVGFSLASDLTSLSFRVDYLCAGSCEIEAYLVNSIGPGSDLVFSGLDMTSGTYALILASSLGIFSWNASAAPSVTSSGASPVNSLIATSFFEAVPFASSFSTCDEAAFLYTIEQGPSAPVPLDGGLLFLLSGLAGL